MSPTTSSLEYQFVMAPEILIEIIDFHNPRLQMAFVNGCGSKTFCEELNLRTGVKCIGWMSAVADEAALRFAQGFYECMLSQLRVTVTDFRGTRSVAGLDGDFDIKRAEQSGEQRVRALGARTTSSARPR